MTTTKFVLLNKADNVFICCQALNAGEVISIDQQKINIIDNIDVGHKLAKEVIKQGQKIIRYGVPIGSATADIEIGEHIHLHNMKSDYISSHTRQSVVGK
jgi:hypothetical protein